MSVPLYSKFIKRFLDICISICFLPILLLSTLIVGILIKIDDGGPVFYYAKRRGYRGKTIRMLKYRSMKVDAPDIRNSDNSTFNSENDERVTRIGRILRKTSVDEIPQLFNVLIGDMSLVGPRPNMAGRPYQALTDLEKARLQVKPGITGYSQAYFRNSITAEEKYKHDCFYVKNYSFLLDLKIVLKTISAVFKKQNIYLVS